MRTLRIIFSALLLLFLTGTAVSTTFNGGGSFAGLTSGSQYVSNSDPFVPSYFFESFEVSTGDCRDEASYFGTTDFTNGAADCDSTTRVFEGSESLEWSGTYASNFFFARDSWSSAVSTGVTEFRMDFYATSTNLASIDNLIRTYSANTGSGPRLVYSSNVNGDNFFGVVCQNSGVYDLVNGSTTVTGSTDYTIIMTYDHDLDIARVYVNSLGDNVLVTPYAMCDGDSTSVPIDGIRLYQPESLPAYVDNIRVGPSFSDSNVYMATDSVAPFGTLNDDDIEAAIDLCEADAPPEGCAIELIAGTYEDVQFAFTPNMRELRGQGQGVSILQGPVTPVTNCTGESELDRGVTYNNSEVNGGVVLVRNDDMLHSSHIHDFSIDGNKQAFSQTNPWQPCGHNGIRIADQTLIPLDFGVIERVTIENMARESLKAEDINGWRIAGNTIRNTGCWEGWQPTGAVVDAMGCGTWGAQAPDEPNPLQVNRKSIGQGIEINERSDNNIIEDNLIEYSTKMGIQSVAAGNALQADYSKNGIIRNNTVRHTSVSGISLVYSEGWLVEGNTVEEIKNPDASGAQGKGIAVSGGGQNTTIRGNTVDGTMGEGIAMYANCGVDGQGGLAPPYDCGTILVEDNDVLNACSSRPGAVFLAPGAFVVEASRWSQSDDSSIEPYAAGPVTVNGGNTLDNASACQWDVYVESYDDVTIEGNTFGDGGTLGGFHAQNASDITFDSAQLTGTGNGVGIDIDNTVDNCTIANSTNGTWGSADADDCAVGILAGTHIVDYGPSAVTKSDALWDPSVRGWKSTCTKAETRPETDPTPGDGCFGVSSRDGWGAYISATAIGAEGGKGSYYVHEWDMLISSEEQHPVLFPGRPAISGYQKLARLNTKDFDGENAGHIDVHEIQEPVDVSVPDEGFCFLKEIQEAYYCQSIPEVSRNEWHSYERRTWVDDETIFDGGTAKMEFLIDGVLVLETPTDYVTLGAASDRVLDASLFPYYNDYMPTDEVNRWIRNFTVTHTPDAVAPATPTGLAASNGDAESVVTWDTGTDDATHYIVEYGCPTVSGQWGGEIAAYTTTITGLTNDAPCQVRVAAEDSANNRSAFTAPFSFTPTGSVAAPYDLGTLPAMVADISWPTMPTPATTVTVCPAGAPTCDFSTIPWATDNQRVEVAAGSYTGGTATCDNCQFVGATGATVSTLLNISGSDVISLEGWWDLDGGLDMEGANFGSVFLDNVHATRIGTGQVWSGFPLDSIPSGPLAVINSTIEMDLNGTTSTNKFNPFVQAAVGPDGSGNFEGRDWIFANVEFVSNGFGWRFQSIENFVMVDSAIGLNGQSINSMRFHHGMTDFLLRDTVAVRLLTGTGSTLDLVNTQWDNVTRYVEGEHEAWCYGSVPTTKVSNCTIENSQVYSTIHENTTAPICSCTSPAGNPLTQLWDGVTLPNSDGSDRPAPLTGVPYGADH